jgi:hypothetical protein
MLILSREAAGAGVRSARDEDESRELRGGLSRTEEEQEKGINLSNMRTRERLLA